MTQSNNQPGPAPAQVTVTYTARYANPVHFAFMERALARFKANATLLADNRLKAAVTQFETAFAEEDRCYHLAVGSALSPQISEADRQRDNALAALRYGIRMHLRSTAEEKRAAAEALDRRLRDYKVNAKDKLDVESAKLTNICQNFAAEPLAAHVALLGLAEPLDAMTEANNKVKELVASRNDERAAEVAAALFTARQATDEAYRRLVLLVNAFALLAENGDYNELIAQLNEDIDYEQQVAKKRRTSSTSSQGGGNTTGGGTETGPTVTDENGTR